MATQMDPKLTSLLTRNTIHADVVEGMRLKKCLSIEDLANWVSNRDDLDKHFIDDTSQKDENSQKSRLRQAWRQAEAITSKGLERVSLGLSSEALDEPLDDVQAKSLEELFTKTYNTRMFPPERIGRDILLGRIFREFQILKPNMYQIAKVKSVGDMALATGTIKRKLGHNATITVDGDDTVDDTDVGFVLHFIDRLELLSNTWALSGIHKVTVGTNEVIFAYWPDCQDYVWKFRAECGNLLGKFSETSIVNYATKIEEAFRLKAIELIRGSEVIPWGQALTRVMKEQVYEWEHKKDILVPYRVPRPQQLPDARGQQRDQEPKKPKPNPREGNPKEGSEHKRNWKTSKYTKDNQEICRRFNDVRGCKQTCPLKFLHVCDCWLEAGRVCANKGHNRMTHKESSSGAVAKTW